MLEKERLIKIKQVISKPSENISVRQSELLKIIIERKYTVIYDTWDGWQIDEHALKRCDFYFKRSYLSKEVRELGLEGEKIFPLGFNYLVFAPFFDKYFIKRSILFDNWRRKIYFLLNAIDLHNSLFARQNVNDIQNIPICNRKPKIIFITRTWSKSMVDESYDTDELESINEYRARCIYLLRKEFGEYFYGGFIPSELAKKKYKALIVKDIKNIRRGKYLQLLKNNFSIGVATNGLRGSIGCKFGEYIALGMAIVAEKLQYEVPGDFQKSENYLSFEEPEECVDQTQRLLEDDELRRRLRLMNIKYYRSFLRPDVLVLNSLLTLLNKV